MFRIPAFAVLLALGLTPPAAAERLPVRVLGLSDGLAQSQVLGMAEADDGRLWVGTLGGGVSIWDGRRFETLGRPDGLRSDQVRAIAPRADGSVWLGSFDDGVDVVREDRVRHVAGASGLRVEDFLGTSDGRWLVATEAGVLVEGDGRLVPVGDSGGDASDPLPVYRLLETAAGEVLAATERGLFRLEDSGPVPFEGAPTERLSALVEDAEGRLWLGGASGLWRLDARGVERLVPGPDVAVWALVERDGVVWAGAEDGLWRIDGAAVDSWGRSAGLPVDRVSSLRFDRDGGLWIGTWGGGLARLPSASFRAWGREAGLGADLVLAFARDSGGGLWIGTYGGGLSRMEGDRIRTWGTAEGLPASTVTDLLERHGELWIATQGGGIASFDGERFEAWGRETGLSSDAIYALLPADGRALWVATYGGGVDLWDPEGPHRRHTAADGLPDDRVFALAPDGEGGVWVGTQSGLGRISAGGVAEDRTREPGWPRVPILALETDVDGALWVGTYGEGLLRVEADRIERIGPLASSEDSVVSLARDAGSLWVGTPRGLVRLDAASWSREGVVRARRFGPSEGFFAQECNQNALLVEDGRLWVGTVDGAWSLDLGVGTRDPRPPTVRVAGVSAPQRGLERRAGPLDLPWRSRDHLRFEVAAVSLAAGDAVEIRSRLVGLDESWGPPQPVQPVSFTHLRPGRYRFEVQARAEPGAWSEAAAYELRIRPPLWGTWQFRASAALGLVGLLWGGLAWRTRALRLERRRLEREVAERTEELVRARDGLAAANDELARSHEVLEEKVGRRTAELSRSVRRLEREIFERREIEKRLAAEKERLRITLASLREGVVTLDAEGRIRMLNSAAEEWLGRPAADVLDERLVEVFEVVAESGDRFDPERQRSFVGTLGAGSGPRSVALTSTPIDDETGRVHGFVIVLREGRKSVAER